MNKSQSRRDWTAIALGLPTLALVGCSTLAGPAADLGLSGVAGVAGYELSGHRVGGAAAGAAAGNVVSQVAQSEVHRDMSEAEKRGYDRALNQAVKQQYWIIQNQQRSRETPPETEDRLVPVVRKARDDRRIRQHQAEQERLALEAQAERDRAEDGYKRWSRPGQTG